MENNFSEDKGHSPNPSYAGRANVSYISLQNAAKEGHLKCLQ